MSKQHKMEITLPKIGNNEQKCFGFHYLQKQLPIVVTTSKSKIDILMGMKRNSGMQKVSVWFKKCKCNNENEIQNDIKIGRDKVSKYYYNELSTNNTNENGRVYYYDTSNETRRSVISDLSAFGIEDCKCNDGDIVEYEYDSMCLSNDEEDIHNIKSNNVKFSNINNKNENFISFCKNIEYKLNV